MLTPQDIQEKEFAKAVFGGYDMGAVDEFLEEVEADYTALYKDNAILKGKIKVLVDKVEEYRSTEDAMRMALLTAQKMSDDMMAETKAKCDAMLREAETAADARLAGVVQDISNEEARLAAARSETAKFVSASRELMNRQADFLSRLNEIVGPMANSSAHAEEPAISPEPEPGRSAVPARAAETAPAQPVLAQPDAAAVNVDSFVDDVIDGGAVYSPSLEETRRVPDLTEAVPEEHRREWTREDEETTPRPKFNFDDLQFGTNYDSDKR